ncbi:MAG: hypothetical protein ABJL49_05520 [Parasphingorhabdus sp.]|uniref:hypothetical protein n=1 Tax=Alphaproteobacteria TaxID=28211 RepID=UPI003265F55F
MTTATHATNDHAKAIISLRKQAGVLVNTMPACPAPSSKLITPSWVIEPHVIDAVIGGVS